MLPVIILSYFRLLPITAHAQQSPNTEVHCNRITYFVLSHQFCRLHQVDNSVAIHVEKRTLTQTRMTIFTMKEIIFLVGFIVYCSGKELLVFFSEFIRQAVFYYFWFVHVLAI